MPPTGRPAVLVVASGLAAVLASPLDEHARGVVAELRQSVDGPAWLDTIGQAEPTRAWIASDVFGDQDSLIVGFAQPVTWTSGGSVAGERRPPHADRRGMLLVDLVPRKLLLDPSTAGPAKAMLAALQARGIDLSDLEAVDPTLQEFGSIKLPESAPKRRRKPTAAPTEIVEAAGRAPVLTRFATLVDFYGDGRKLTQTGQPTLADARAPSSSSERKIASTRRSATAGSRRSQPPSCRSSASLSDG